MSVDPVNTSLTGNERQTLDQKVQAATPPKTYSGTTPKSEDSATPNGSIAPLFPEHEVKVQLDTPEDDIVVYQVLDKQSGNLVLQVPSAEQLRGLHQTQELLQRIALRGKASISDEVPPTVVKREESNGSKF